MSDFKTSSDAESAKSAETPHATAAENSTESGAFARLRRSFGFAMTGIASLLHTQRNARIEFGIGVIACGLGVWLRISLVEWAVLVATIAQVLILEGLNTAIEAAVDLASPQLHPKAKLAKDLAAGMVLIAAIGSVIVGIILFGPPLWLRLHG